MAERTVRIGAIAYRRADGADVFGYRGDVVAVHDDDLDRFDGINGDPIPADGEPSDGDLEQGAPVRPAGSASLADWQGYAIASGASPEDIEGMTRDALREQYGA